MISSDTIKILAKKLQTTELNIRREYIQHLFLAYFYLQKGSGEICFKGGTALRIIFGSPRFSEDLDFSTAIDKVMAIEDIILDTIRAVEKEGIGAQVLVSKETSGGYLSQLLFHLGPEKILIELNISRRKKPIASEVFSVVSDLIPAYTVFCLSTDQLVTEKIQALLSRQKPRDFFDLYFILRKGLLSVKEKKVLSQIAKTLKKTSLNFDKELKQFLPKSHWPIIKNFKVSLEREIRRNF